MNILNIKRNLPDWQERVLNLTLDMNEKLQNNQLIVTDEIARKGDFWITHSAYYSSEMNVKDESYYNSLLKNASDINQIIMDETQGKMQIRRIMPLNFCLESSFEGLHKGVKALKQEIWFDNEFDYDGRRDHKDGTIIVEYVMLNTDYVMRNKVWDIVENKLMLNINDWDDGYNDYSDLLHEVNDIKLEEKKLLEKRCS